MSTYSDCDSGHCYVALSDVTLNRGRVEYVGNDEAAAREAVDGAGRVYHEHPASAETPAIGARAYRDGTYAWTSCGYDSTDYEAAPGIDTDMPSEDGP